MTLEEAIKHCEEVAEELEKRVKPYQCESINKKLYEVNKKEWDECLECASEHRQLAEWLKELRELRRNRIGRVSVGCATCIHMKTDDYTKRPCDRCCNNYFSKYEAEVKADEDSD